MQAPDESSAGSVPELEPVTVTSEPMYLTYSGAVTACCEDLRKIHERLCRAEEALRLAQLDFAEMGGHIEGDLGCGGEGSQ